MSKLIRNTIIYTVAGILPQLVNFVLLPVYTKYLTPGEYGIVNSMQVLGSIMLVVFTLAVERGLYRIYYDYKTESERRDYLGTILTFIIFSSTAIAGIMFAFAHVVVHIFSSIPFFPYFTYAILSSLLASFSLVPIIYFQIEEQASKYFFVSLGQFLLSAAATVLLIVVYGQGAKGMLAASVIAGLIFLPVFVYYSIRIANIRFRWDALKKNIAFSVPLLPSIIMAWVMNVSDRIFVERFDSLADVGIYSLGYKLASITTLVAAGFFSAYTPVFYKTANTDDQEQAKNLLKSYNNKFLLAVLFLSFAVAFFAKELVLFLVNKKYYDAFTVIPVVSLAFFFSQGSGIFNLMIYQEKKTLQIMYITVSGGLFNIGGNFLLIPRFGYLGAAYSTLATFFFLALVSFWYARRCYFVPLDWVKNVPAFIALTGICYAVNYLVPYSMIVLAFKILVFLLVLVYFDRELKLYDYLLKRIRPVIRQI